MCKLCIHALSIKENPYMGVYGWQFRSSIFQLTMCLKYLIVLIKRYNLKFRLKIPIFRVETRVIAITTPSSAARQPSEKQIFHGMDFIFTSLQISHHFHFSHGLLFQRLVYYDKTILGLCSMYLKKKLFCYNMKYIDIVNVELKFRPFQIHPKVLNSP